MREGNNWKIDYNFIKEGKYVFEIVFHDIIYNMSNFFEKCTNIISLDLSNFNTSNIIDMRRMFNHCSKLKEIKGMNNFFTNKVESMEGMFQLCNELEYLDISNWNTSNVTSMACIFNMCNKLKEIKGINNFITNKVESTGRMFQNYHELEQLDLSNWTTCNVIYVESMFIGCTKLKEIKGINTVITNKVQSMKGMFQSCHELEYLDLSNWNTSNVNNIGSMFNQCFELK